MDLDKRNVLTVLTSFIPVARNSVRVREFRTYLSKDQYDALISYFNKADLYRRSLDPYHLAEIKSKQPEWIDHGRFEFTELNMVRQFFYWYDRAEPFLEDEDVA